MVEWWRRIPILLNLQLQLIDGATFNNLTCLIVQNLLDFGGMNKTKVAKKLVCFGVYGMATFQGVKFGVTTKLMQKHIPFVSDVNNMVDHTNFLIQTINSLRLVFKIKLLFVDIYNYFIDNLKWAFEASNLVELLECKNNKKIIFIGFLCCHLPSGS